MHSSTSYSTLIQIYKHMHINLGGSEKMRSSNVISVFAQPVSTSQESFQTKSCRLNSFLLIVTLFHSMDTLVYSTILFWMYTQVVSRFTPSSNVAIRDFDHASLLLMLSFLPNNQISMINSSCLFAIWNSFHIVYLYPLSLFLQFLHQLVCKNSLYIMHNNIFVSCTVNISCSLSLRFFSL